MNLRVKELRERHGLSKVELAGRAAINPATLWRIETGQSSPTIYTLEQIAKGLGVGVDELLPTEAEPTSGAMWIDGVGWVRREES